MAVLAGSTPSDAATSAQRVATLAGPRSAAGNELAAGTQLKGGSRLESPNGRYRLAMQADGNLVLYGEGHPLWASGTAGHPGAFLVMQGDGNLVVYQANRPIWSSGTDRGGRAAYYLSLQDNGNATIDSPAGKAIWAAGAAVGAGRAELVAGTQLKGGSWLESPNGRYQLAMQADGNLVLYGEGHPLWASNTAGHPGAFLAMQGDGNLVVYQASRPIWSSGTDRGGNAPYYLTLQDTGNATIDSPVRKPIWASDTAVVGLQLGDLGPAVKLLQTEPHVPRLLDGDARRDLRRLDPTGRLGAPEGGRLER